MDAVVLTCDGARLEGDQLPRGSFDAGGPRLALLGDWSFLFDLLTGRRRLASGRVEVCGADAEGAASRGQVGVMPADHRLPERWRVSEVLEAGAALTGAGRRESRYLARGALSRVGLSLGGAERVGGLDALSRRGVCLALALLGEPQAVAFERPFGELEPSERVRFGESLARALGSLPWLVALGSPGEDDATDRLLQQADEVLVLGRGGLSMRGSHAELAALGRAHRLVVTRNPDDLCRRLIEAGYEATLTSSSEVSVIRVRDAEELGTARLLGLAARADAPVLELSPLSLGEEGA